MGSGGRRRIKENGRKVVEEGTGYPDEIRTHVDKCDDGGVEHDQGDVGRSIRTVCG